MSPQGGGATAAGAGVEQVSREMQRLHMPEEGPPVMMHGTDGKTYVHAFLHCQHLTLMLLVANFTNTI